MFYPFLPVQNILSSAVEVYQLDLSMTERQVGGNMQRNVVMTLFIHAHSNKLC
uniref:Uncharacterized protein n=1 Tax=Arion vulgaris TaxID=1028688 RepID=A0A0B7ATM0_9EUPU